MYTVTAISALTRPEASGPSDLHRLSVNVTCNWSIVARGTEYIACLCYRTDVLSKNWKVQTGRAQLRQRVLRLTVADLTPNGKV